jgi:GntR family transcriptional regulator
MRGILNVNPADPIPIWKQIEAGMRRLVAAGTLKPGAPVPSVRDLAKELQVNPATVAKGYQGLVDSGLLEMRRGEGTFVKGDQGSLDRERQSLLAEGAARFAAMGAGLGFNLAELESALGSAWARQNRKGASR